MAEKNESAEVAAAIRELAHQVDTDKLTVPPSRRRDHRPRKPPQTLLRASLINTTFIKSGRMPAPAAYAADPVAADVKPQLDPGGSGSDSADGAS